MKHFFIKKEGNRKLLLFFAGWGSSPELFSGYKVADGYDCLLCYDYKDLAFDGRLTDGYESVSVIAWSFGVWAADMVCSGMDAMDWDGAVAFGGTVFPIDDNRGIPVTVFDGTLAGMSGQVLTKFRRRMCGHDLGHFNEHLPQRTLEDMTEELAALGAMAHSLKSTGRFLWTKAVAGREDLIFPFANQCSAWNDVGVELVAVDAAHYDVNVFEKLLGGDFF